MTEEQKQQVAVFRFGVIHEDPRCYVHDGHQNHAFFNTTLL